MVRFIDSHCHLADAKFQDDLSDVINRSKQAGADSVICIGASLEQAVEASKIAAAYPTFVRYTAGIHPHDAADFDIKSGIPQLRRFFGSFVSDVPEREGSTVPKNRASDSGSGSDLDSSGDILAVAVGECGLDYHYDHSPRDIQRRVFAAQLGLAQEFSRPVVVHTREAEDDTMAMVAEAGRSGITGVLHCFTGTMKLAEVAIEAGWYISFSGIITFKKWDGAEIARLVPQDRLLVESDSPYLAPVPFRGKRNEPAWVANTLAQLAALREVGVEELAPIVIENTNRLFS